MPRPVWFPKGGVSSFEGIIDENVNGTGFIKGLDLASPLG
jgi:hypothetical protein